MSTMTQDQTLKSVSLYMTQGASDKEYHVQLVQTEAGYLVNMQNGRRGGTLTQRTKTASPVALQVAQKTYEQLVQSKLKDGYTQDTSGKAFAQSEQAFTGIVPQLLNPITEEQAGTYLESTDWIAQEKHDGHRRLMQQRATGILSINRKGISCGMPQETLCALQSAFGSSHEYLLDGELIGSHYYIFDVLQWEGKALQDEPLHVRLKCLEQLDVANTPLLHVSTPAYSTNEKICLFERLKAEHREGIVFKHKDALYQAGRPASGGYALKCKFVKTATVRVHSVLKNKRSVNIEILDTNGKWMDLGKVTIPANARIPSPHTMLEVRYLYAYPNGGALAQPTYIMERTDLDDTACTITQLVFKKEQEEEDDN